MSAMPTSRVDLGAVLKAAIASGRSLIAGRGQRITLSIPVRTVWVGADAESLRRVLLHLLHEASDCTLQEGSIRIAIAKGTEAVSIAIGDIDPAAASERVASARALLDRDCRVVLEHRPAAGGSSEWVVRLPVDPADAIPVASPPMAATGLPPMRIVIADDNRDAARSLATLLRLAGADARPVFSGRAAIDECRDFAPHAVLLDIDMPAMNGLEVAHCLKPASPKTLLVALTGLCSAAERRAALDAGFDHHLAKPVDMRLLRQLLLGVAHSSDPSRTLVDR